uniref:hypothetical protein n=1 Tax=Aeromonas fluvialis TaxID=591962 RepID=UPI0005A97091
ATLTLATPGAAGSLGHSEAIVIGANPAIVVFDLVEGVSSSHSSRTFSEDVAYTIYIRVNSASSALSTDGVGPGASDSWGAWGGAGNLGNDDRVILVGSGSPLSNGPRVVTNTDRWFTGGVSGLDWGDLTSSVIFPGFTLVTFSRIARLASTGRLSRIHNGSTRTVDLFAGTIPNMAILNGAGNQLWTNAIPTNILNSQGLA